MFTFGIEKGKTTHHINLENILFVQLQQILQEVLKSHPVEIILGTYIHEESHTVLVIVLKVGGLNVYIFSLLIIIVETGKFY